MSPTSTALQTDSPGRRLRAAHAAADPLVAPLAHDALSARLIEAAGFPAFNIGGSTLLAARNALPDIGLAALGEMAAAIGDVVDAVPDLPCLVDADDGYGDEPQVRRSVQVLERLGVGGVILEDQVRLRKQPGASAAQALVPLEDMERKLEAALSARRDPELVIMARTDALGKEGLAEALRRGERYLTLGADALFVTGAKEAGTLEEIGRAFRGSWNMAALFERPGESLPAPGELRNLGFSHIVYPMAMMQRVAATMDSFLEALRDLAAGRRRDLPNAEEHGAESLAKALDAGRWRGSAA